MPKRGYIQVYTAKGDELNFAPIGLGLRAAGHSLRTHMTCFSPHQWMDGSRMAAILLKPYLFIEQANAGTGSSEALLDKKEIKAAKQSFQRARQTLLSGDFDIVILNGLHRILSQGVISLDELLEFTDYKPGHVELVIAGLEATDELVARADLVTEMVCQDPAHKRPKKEQPKGSAPAEVVTGNGKGKTTYCLGKAMLMSCLGIRSTFLQFIKSPKAYGEVKASKRLPYLDIKSMGEGFLDMGVEIPERKHLEAARRAWEKCLREIFSLEYGLVVLDEINLAAHYGFVHAQRVREMLFLKPQGLHLIMSGRNAPHELIAGASNVIEMREVKHPFSKGIKARKGIEF